MNTQVNEPVQDNDDLAAAISEAWDELNLGDGDEQPEAEVEAQAEPVGEPPESDVSDDGDGEPGDIDPFGALDDDDRSVVEYMRKEVREGLAEIPEEFHELRNKLIHHYKEQDRSFQKKMVNVGPDAKTGEFVRELLEEDKQFLNETGRDANQHILSLVRADRMLRQDPVQGIKALMEMFGVSSLDEDDGIYDPVQRELKQVKGELDQLRNNAQNEKHRTALQKVQAFASETNEKGELLRPLFGKLAPQIREYLSSTEDKDLQKAYDAVVADLGMGGTERPPANPAPRRTVKDKLRAASALESQPTEVVDDTEKSLAEDLSDAWDKTGGFKF